jgi:hypothetical protein
MKRALMVLAGISLLLISLGMGLSSGRALAMNSNSNSNDGSCGNSGYPAPYTGGASVVKFFHLSDGSTVTITSTGAVIKQGRCGTPYREGWINVSDICSTQSAQDLNGHLSSGSSNPNGSTGFSSCKATQNPSGQQTGTITIVNNNSQSQSQSSGGSGTQAVATASTKTSNGTSAVQAASTTATTQSTAATKTLPNTGPGNILMLSGATTAVGTIGHLFYSRRGRN